MNAVSTERRDFISYPTNRVVGTVGDAENARAAIDALLKAGFEEQCIDILHGEEDLKRLDPTGSEHGFLAQFQRTLIRTFDLDEFKHLMHHVEDVREGRYVIMVLTKRRGQRIIAGDILHQHGAEFVGFYGRWAWEGLPPTAQKRPEDIPVVFVRAWNDRDATALASVFDEDAEFVDGTGACLHDREAIRKAHADGLAHANGSSRAIDDMKVRFLTPAIAVVRARFTETGQSPKAASTPPAAVVSFVVHRHGDRWLCASAHTTNVVQ